MARLTIEQIEAIRERSENATEGPWFAIHNTDICVEEPQGSSDITTVAFSVSDAEFIANARQDIPALLAEVAYLTGVIGTLKSNLEVIGEQVEGEELSFVKEAIKYAEENLR
jgi:hypothetical protein